VERIFRDLRLASIWTGTNEVMSVIIANEWYRQYRHAKKADWIRDTEPDAAQAHAKDEKIFE
jgi:butyryl-CoA dehydrogenase